MTNDISRRKPARVGEELGDLGSEKRGGGQDGRCFTFGNDLALAEYHHPRGNLRH